MRRLAPFACTLALTSSVPALLPAQAPADSGSFVVRHGRDTVATEQFVRTPTRLEGTIAIRNAKRLSERYTAIVGPDGTLPLIEVTVREGVDSGNVKAKIVQRARVIFKQDSAAVDEVGSTGLMTRVFGTEEGAIPYLNLSFALLEQAVRRWRATPGSSQVAFFSLGGGQTLKASFSTRQRLTKAGYRGCSLSSQNRRRRPAPRRQDSSAGCGGGAEMKRVFTINAFFRGISYRATLPFYFPARSSAARCTAS